MTLQEYLGEAAKRPVAWGSFDCMLYLADWVRDQRGIDPAAAWRGHYTTEREATRIAEHYDGLVGLVGHAVRDILDTTDFPRRGDIAVVRPAGHSHAGGAIRTEIGWAVLKRHGGLWVGQHSVIAAWRID